MYAIQYGSIRSARIRDFVGAAAAVIDSQNWLFVAIDSSRGDALARAGEYFSKRLAEQNIQSWSGPEGLWIPGKFLKGACRRTNIIVPYSAAYIFDCNIGLVNPPRYTNTSECDDFSNGLPEIVKMDLEKFGANGYIADGDDLNYAFRGPWIASANAALCDIQRAGESMR